MLSLYFRFISGACRLVGLGLPFVLISTTSAWAQPAPQAPNRLRLGSALVLPADCTADEGGAHGGHGIRHDEHRELIALVSGSRGPRSQSTNWAVQSGPWSNAGTWANGVVPKASDRICIPASVAVTIDTTTAVADWVRVNGTLQYATNVNTQLKVETVIVTPSGRFVMGDSSAGIAANVKAKLVFADRGPIDRTWDTFMITRGLISHGSVAVRGSPYTQFVTMPIPTQSAPSVLTLDAPVPPEWKIGDSINVTSTYWTKSDTRRKILAIAGNKITIAPLTDEYQFFGTTNLPLTNGEFRQPAYKMYVANLERNAIFESENITDRKRRGHVMFMHNPDVTIANAGFYELGRTDKKVDPNEETIVAADGTVARFGENPKGRYALHYHRTGIERTSKPALVTGSVIVGGPGWGLVNHSSYVIATDNVTYEAGADSFVTEVGDEIGEFRHNLIMHVASYSQDNPDLQDYGRKGGSGIFMVGAGVKVFDNIINNMYNGGFGTGIMFLGYAYFGEGEDPEAKVMFPAANLDDPSLAKGAPSIDPGLVPWLVRGNEVFAAGRGVGEQGKAGGLTNLIENNTFWNVRSGVGDQYSDGYTARGNFIHFIDGEGFHRDWPFYRLIEANYVTGTGLGVITNSAGVVVIKNNILKCSLFNIVIDRTDSDQNFKPTGGVRTTEISGNIFGEPAVNPHSANHYDIFAVSDNPSFPINVGDHKPDLKWFLSDITTDNGRYFSRRIWSALQPDRITVNGKRLYLYPDQRADFKWHDTHSVAFDGMTNQQLWDAHNVAMGDSIMPLAVQNGSDDPSIKLFGAKLGPMVPYRPQIHGVGAHPIVDGKVTWNVYDTLTGTLVSSTLQPQVKSWNFYLSKDLTGAPRTTLAWYGPP